MIGPSFHAPITKQAARKEVKAAQSLILKDELKRMQRVLRRMGYVDPQGVITVKGKASQGKRGSFVL